jgi:hypothetical protein
MQEVGDSAKIVDIVYSTLPLSTQESRFNLGSFAGPILFAGNAG